MHNRKGYENLQAGRHNETLKMKKSKLATPEWITEGYDSKADWEKAQGIESKKKKTERTFKIKVCPKCGSDDVGIILINSEEEEGGGDNWECRKCGWKGENIKIKELNEEELMEFMDNKGEEVA